MLGLKRRTVKLSAHDKKWVSAFEREKINLGKIFQKEAVAIEHIGSTSIPDLLAKPLIDIAVGLGTMKEARKYIKILEQAGYFYRPNWGRPDQHLLFAKGNEKRRTHYIHVVKYKGKIWNRDIVFRDYLRKFPKRARGYEKLKTVLAKRYPDDRPTYTKLKTEFILETVLLAKARKVSKKGD